MAHSLITKHILKKLRQGKFRVNNVFVITKDGKIEYVEALPEKVKTEMDQFYADVDTLVKINLSFEKTLFFAAMIHLVFVKIHPFNDGNGRIARLLEKWFLSQKIGEKAWFFQSERNYYNFHLNYYTNIRKLGLDYEVLNYQAALLFLQMLPNAINHK